MFNRLKSKNEYLQAEKTSIMFGCFSLGMTVGSVMFGAKIMPIIFGVSTLIQFGLSYYYNKKAREVVE